MVNFDKKKRDEILINAMEDYACEFKKHANRGFNVGFMIGWFLNACIIGAGYAVWATWFR